jgi:hypothetical protein
LAYSTNTTAARAAGQLVHEPVVRVCVPEHPATAVHVQDHRQRALDAGRAHDPHPDVPDIGRDGNPGLVDGQYVDRRRLHVVEHLARLAEGQLVQEWRRGARLHERLRGGLERDTRQRVSDGHETSASLVFASERGRAKRP